MRKLVVLHFNPLELYPPAMNLLQHLAQTLGPDTEIIVYTQSTGENLPEFKISGASVRIIRRGIQKSGQSPLRRLLGYWRYYSRASLDLFRHRPDVVLAVETLSVLPAYLYKKWGAGRSALMIHYHEYISLTEYRDGMKLQRWIHGLECKVYPQTAWVSHTNEERMRRFLQDHVPVKVPHTAIIPNYPTRSWIRPEPKTQERPLRVVYVGSVDLNTMYVKEFAEWVVSRNGEVVWDIYALHVPAATQEYLETVQPEWIRFRGSCYYYDLPHLLQGYDVGVVLYKGVMPNHIYAVSNKVLEYAVCGLDVWYAREMVGTYPYDTPGAVYPKIIPLDFTKMDTFDPGAALKRDGKQFSPAPYNCEEALQPLVTAIEQVHEKRI
jgi:hypothetical protein